MTENKKNTARVAVKAKPCQKQAGPIALPTWQQTMQTALAYAQDSLERLDNAISSDLDWGDADVDADVCLAMELALERIKRMRADLPAERGAFEIEWYAAASVVNLSVRVFSRPDSYYFRCLETEYIQTRKPPEFASCTDRIGWHGKAFVLPHETIGDDAERIVFQSDNQMENTFRIKRDADEWRDRVGQLCVGNSRLVFAVASAFAGPLLRPAGMESGGFHLRGDSSSGKTTALRLAASVYGGPSFMQRWRTTDNALEAIAAQHCDSLLILDELAQVEGKVAGECAYMLANEQSKARATRNGAAWARLSWRLLFLSAGELGLADHMAEGGKRTRTGQEVRMADIPADAGAGMGAFERLHGLPDGAAFSTHLAREAQLCHGAVGRAFLEWATANADTLGKKVRNAVGILASTWVPNGANGQVARVAARFALVGVAGALATEAGLTGLG